MTRHKHQFFLVVAGIALLVLFAVGGTLAGNGFSIPWWTVDGGSGVSTGGSYTMSGTIGQSDAGQMTGGSYTLNGGFGPGSTTPSLQFRVFLPTILSNSTGTSSSGFR